jgi:uncharacterized protein with PIN domain
MQYKFVMDAQLGQLAEVKVRHYGFTAFKNQYLIHH